MPGGGLAYFPAGIVDSGKTGLHDLADNIIVEANDGYITGDVHSFFFQGLHTDRCTEIIGHKKAVGPGVHFYNLPGGFDSGGLTEVINDDPVFTVGQAVFEQGLAVARKPVGVYISFQAAGDVNDVPATLLNKVAGGDKSCFNIVDHYFNADGFFFHPVEVYDGDVFLYEGVEMVDAF